ncbi:MAG: DUF4239 domain-containing protein [Chloroflexi bacterium]|nr:MAG: DUF4239 domain-containing protein [Chloroflexota bacterium]
MSEPLDSVFQSQWVVFALPAVLLVGFAELGFRLGLRLYVATDTARKGEISGIQGALLGLLGLLLGFTFAMAVSRYQARRDLVVKEANAIGTTFLRASLLPEAHQAPVEDLLRRYVEARLTFQPLAADPVKLAEGLRLSADIQRQLWQHAVAVAKETPTPIVATFVITVNETIDTEAERLAAARDRIPGTVWLLLLTVASLGCVTSNYIAGADGARSVFSSIVFPLLVAVVIILIFDLADPSQGLIRITQQPLVDLQDAIQANVRSGP